MTPAELLQRLTDDEDHFVERKSNGVSPGEVRRTATAFANQLATDETGILFIGIANNGDIVGVENTDSMQKKVRKACHDECYPLIEYSSQILEKDGKKLLAVVIPASSTKPHFAGPAYIRVGSESVKATAELYEQLIASRNEKCGAIQRLGRTTLTVISHKKLGDTRFIPDRHYRERRECTVAHVDAHHVRLFDIGHSEYYSESLINVEIATDEKRHRPMLIIEKPR